MAFIGNFFFNLFLLVLVLVGFGMPEHADEFETQEDFR